MRFRPKANINYLYLLALYDLAEYNSQLNIKDTIHYQSARLLGNKLGVSTSTINRIFDNTAYNDFMRIDKQNKCITLYNYFQKGKSERFIRLTAKEVQLIRNKKDELFTRYLIYLKYYCGYTNNNTDFTAKQFLQDCEYSIKSGSQISNISNYNSLLVNEGLISIQKFTDELGNERNRYMYFDID